MDKRTESQFDNVYDLNATRYLKQVTGKVMPIKKEPSDPGWEEHVHSAMEQGNPHE